MIISILPLKKIKFQQYSVKYNSPIENTMIAREKIILKHFNINKQEFKTILLKSIKENLDI